MLTDVKDCVYSQPSHHKAENTLKATSDLGATRPHFSSSSMAVSEIAALWMAQEQL